ncbi:RelA/SpoT family protein [Acetobacteroides hydrogenigenes]|uniref:GTP pyrophosphokinase n=1 Tax=Acetobacteroides hydrogenigenes TaxID=979970 RepID=A0A4R2EFK5_9BACT|nr:RelA/SpoT family protein [Acetobacteroides hydrogenigenes]TCN67698.1 GTP pyrophosphokinase [Acetobacteroides hydrogenigenes]
MAKAKQPQVSMEEEQNMVNEHFEEMLSSCIRDIDENGVSMIRRAFEFANEAHMGVRRKSGEPYILHPIAVARIVAHEIGLGAKSISSALLHDVVEDTEFTIEDIEHRFGPKIAYLVDGLTKMSGVFDQNASLQAENFRKMLLTITDDIRVIIIKLADRLHNMRTLDSMPPHKQMKIASETIYLFAPLAHRLGLYAIKTELEDLSLKYRFPEAYNSIQKRIEETETTRYELIQQFTHPILEKLQESNIIFDMNSRMKSVYSIWRKMQVKKVSFEEIYDLFAIRIVFTPSPGIPERAQCWHIYSIITEIYKPKPDRLRDWVSTPKANGYEALHCTVMGPLGTWVEVQIRSERMNDIAERGFAAHWKYKSGDQTAAERESELDKWIRRIRELLEDPKSDAIEFLEDFKLNLFGAEIVLFTPKGMEKVMPQGTTALDFAYEIHSEIGNHAIGAKVNHKLVPLNHTLNSGDQVEILTANNQKPQSEWLNFATTAKAKSYIKSAIKSEVKNRIAKGKEILATRLQELGLTPNSRVLNKLLPAYNVQSKEEFYSKIGAGIINIDDFKKVLKQNKPNRFVRYWNITFGGLVHISSESDRDTFLEDEVKSGVDLKKPFMLEENVVDNTATLSYVRSECCRPIPGDDVIGYLDEDDNVVVHKKGCPEAIRLSTQHGDRIVNAKWSVHKLMSFLSRIEVRGIDRIGVISDIAGLISNQLNVNMRRLTIESHDGIFEGFIDLYVHSRTDLNNLILGLMKIKGIDSINRVEKVEE